MNDDILLNGLPALKIDENTFLLYAPHKNVIISIPTEKIKDPDTIDYLRSMDIFKWSNTSYSNTAKNIVLNITNKCNLFCSYCWANSSPFSNKNMSPETALNIVKHYSDKEEIERIHFMGGEPTVNFETIKTVATFFHKQKTKNFPIYYITTNGVVGNRKLEWLIENNFAFSISWDGLLSSSLRQRVQVNGDNNDEITRETILKVANSELPLRVRMTVSNFNLDTLYESVSWLANNGVKYIHIEAVSPDGRGAEFSNNYAPAPEQFANEFFKIVKLAEEKNVWLMNSHLANLYSLRNYYCSSLTKQTYNINVDGSISHCYKTQSSKDKLSDFFVVGYHSSNGKSIKIDETHSSILSRINVEKYNECENSPLKNIYSGGCPYRNRSASNSSNKVDKRLFNTSRIILREAILHIYNRALRGKTTALEGYVKFYNNLRKPEENKYNKPNVRNKKFYTGKLRNNHSVKFIPIPVSFNNVNIDVDACDICI